MKNRRNYVWSPRPNRFHQNEELFPGLNASPAGLQRAWARFPFP